MSEIVTPKFPPTWDAWGAIGDRCCCEPFMTPKQICCDGDFWFLSKYGDVGLLKRGSQQILNAGSIDSYYHHSCCGGHFVLWPFGDARGDLALIWHGADLLYSGPYVWFVIQTCDSDYYGIRSDPNVSYAGKIWHKKTQIYDGNIYDILANGRSLISRNYRGAGLVNGIKAWFDGTELYDGVTAGLCTVGDTGSGDKYIVLTAEGDGMMVWYEGTLVHQQATASVLAYLRNDYLILRTGSNLQIFYKGTNIYSGTGTLGNLGCGDYLFVSVNGTGIVYYRGEIIYSGTYESEGACFGDYFVLFTSSGCIAWYLGERIYEGASYMAIPCHDYLLIAKTGGTAILFHKGGSIYDDAYFGRLCWQDQPTKGFVLQPTSNTAIAFYEGEIVAEGEYGIQISTGGSGVHYFGWKGDFLLLTYSSSSMLRIWHKKKLIYDGPFALKASGNYLVPDYSQCGDFLIIHPRSNTTIVFHEDKQVEYEQEKYVDYICCSERAYSTNDDETIDIWDTTFGKMKFDLNTFSRLA